MFRQVRTAPSLVGFCIELDEAIPMSLVSTFNGVLRDQVVGGNLIVGREEQAMDCLRHPTMTFGPHVNIDLACECAAQVVVDWSGFYNLTDGGVWASQVKYNFVEMRHASGPKDPVNLPLLGTGGDNYYDITDKWTRTSSGTVLDAGYYVAFGGRGVSDPRWQILQFDGIEQYPLVEPLPVGSCV